MHFKFNPIPRLNPILRLNPIRGGEGYPDESAFNPASARQRKVGGFTLIELMIVVSIIAVLATLVTKMIQQAQAKAAEAQATTDISTLKNALEQFNRDEGVYPGWDLDVDDPEEFNGFPSMFEGIAGERPPNGKGGKNAPYLELNTSNIVVIDEDFEEEYKKAGRSDLFDPDVEKFY